MLRIQIIFKNTTNREITRRSNKTQIFWFSVRNSPTPIKPSLHQQAKEHSRQWMMEMVCMVCIGNVSTRLGCSFSSASASGFGVLWHWLHICRAVTFKFSASCKKKKNLVPFNFFFFSSNLCFRETACAWPPLLAAFPSNPDTTGIALLVLFSSEPAGLSSFCLCVYQRAPLQGSHSQWVTWKPHTWFALKLGEPGLSLELL